MIVACSLHDSGLSLQANERISALLYLFFLVRAEDALVFFESPALKKV